MTSNNYRLQSIEYIEGNDSIDLELSDVDEFLLGNVAELNKKMDINNVFGQGATNIYQVGPVIDNFEKNASTTYKITLKIYVPTEAIAINKVTLNWSLSGFRTTTKVGSTTTNAETAHTHYIVDTWNSADVYLMGAAASPTNRVSAATGVNTQTTDYATGVGHSHTIDVAEQINEQAAGSPTMQLDVNSVGVASYAGNQTDIDITDNIIYGWNIVDLYPTTNLKGRCQLDAFVKLFIEST